MALLMYLGHYATGKALESAGVVSSNDMTLEAISCKLAYLMGRGDLARDEIANLMCVSMRGEGTYMFSLHWPCVLKPRCLTTRMLLLTCSGLFSNAC